MPKIFRFEDVEEKAEDRPLIELRDGNHYTMRVGPRDQNGESAVKLHELLEHIHNLARKLAEASDGDLSDPSAIVDQVSAADTRLLYDHLRDLARLIVCESIPDATLDLHNIQDLTAVMEQYFALWTPLADIDRKVNLVESQA